MKVSIDTVRVQLSEAAATWVSEDEAAYFADLVLESHLRKAPRMNPLKDAVDDLKVWAAADTRDVTVEVDKESVLLLDFGGLAPALKIKYVHDELQRRARKNGLAAVGFRNSSGVITLDPWSEGLAGRDLIGIAMFDGGTRCTVPHGGTRGVFGTLPLAYAVPTAGAPVTLDMAMTEIPFFQIKEAKENGISLPPGVAVDRRGLPTTDAAAALDDDGVANLLPLGGGFKGYGLVMLIEILTGSLVRSLLSTSQTPGWNPRSTEDWCAPSTSPASPTWHASSGESQRCATRSAVNPRRTVWPGSPSPAIVATRRLLLPTRWERSNSPTRRPPTWRSWRAGLDRLVTYEGGTVVGPPLGF